MIARLIGRVLCQPKVHNRLLAIAMRTADEHIMSPDGTDVYMYRYWLFNKITNYKRKYRFIPFSIRIHRIMRHDLDRHLHDHPFNARTWIMRGGYEEVRLRPFELDNPNWNDELVEITRVAGDTSTLGFEKYHKITKIAEGGALTFFMFGPYKGQWGFRVDGRKMLHKEYIARWQKPAPPLHIVVTADNQVGAQIDRSMWQKAWNIDRNGAYPNCEAKQYSDATYCERCNVGWDTNDPKRPPCATLVPKD